MTMCFIFMELAIYIVISITMLYIIQNSPHPRDYDELIVELLNGITFLCKKEF